MEPVRSVNRLQDWLWLPLQLILNFIIILPEYLWLLPGFLYRWTLKSTCWLYLPIVYVGDSLRRRSHTPEGKVSLLADFQKNRVENIRRVLALLVVASLVITTSINHDRQEYALGLTYLWAFDLFNLAPWQWLNLLGAILTGGLFFYSDQVNRIWTLAKEQTSNATPEEGNVARLLLMVRLRDLCAILYILLAFGYCVLALGGIDKELLTGWLEPLHFLYGPYL